MMRDHFRAFDTASERRGCPVAMLLTGESKDFHSAHDNLKQIDLVHSSTSRTSPHESCAVYLNRYARILQ